MVKLRYECFWPNLEADKFFISKYFENVIITKDNDYDILVCSVFPYNISKDLVVKPNVPIILFNGEHPNYIINFINVTKIIPTILMGFTDLDPILLKNYFRDRQPLILYYPLWILYYDDIFSQEYFDNKNKEVSMITREELFNKKICCLINSHDNNNTRTPIYNYIKNISGSVDCPGNLYRNMDKSHVGSTNEDKLRFMKNYKFNICAENSVGHGYLTEKLPQAMDALCIPLYVGCSDFNKLNFKIFNKDRVVFLNTQQDYDNLLKLLASEKELYEMYTKPIFNTDAFNKLKKFMDLTKDILLKHLKIFELNNKIKHV
jgi:hypothetical protein